MKRVWQGRSGEGLRLGTREGEVFFLKRQATQDQKKILTQARKQHTKRNNFNKAALLLVRKCCCSSVVVEIEQRNGHKHSQPKNRPGSRSESELTKQANRPTHAHKDHTYTSRSRLTRFVPFPTAHTQRHRQGAPTIPSSSILLLQPVVIAPSSSCLAASPPSSPPFSSSSASAPPPTPPSTCPCSPLGPPKPAWKCIWSRARTTTPLYKST